MNTKEENKAQCEAFASMHGNVLEMIEIYGAEFRQIINDFEAEFGKCPSGNDLLWIASEHAGRNIRER